VKLQKQHLTVFSVKGVVNILALKLGIHEDVMTARKNQLKKKGEMMKLPIYIFASILFGLGIFSYRSTAEQIVPATYIGPDTIDERESFMIACMTSVDPSMNFKNEKDIISLCHAVSVELYGVAGFVYINRSGEEISRIKSCFKAGSPEERKVCGK